MERILNFEELKEKTSHGNTLFPFYIYKNTGEKNILTPHWHNEIEFIYLTRGKAKIFLDSTSFMVKSGEVVVVNSGVIHSGKAVSNNRCKFHSIVFDLKLLNSRLEDDCQIKFINPLINQKYRLKNYLTRNQSWSEKVIDILEEIIETFYNRNTGYELKIKSLLYLALYNFNADKKIIKVKDDLYKIKRLKKALKFIHNNYDKNIGLKEIADKINLSKYYFCRFFKKRTGTTPIEYLNFYRINKAVEMLQETEKKIIDISMEVGFSSNSYFIKVFKQYMDCTPSEYRKQNVI
ncbi:MAG: AraC family transcriptional regulator [Halanaerobiaceae bacterium]